MLAAMKGKERQSPHPPCRFAPALAEKVALVSSILDGQGKRLFPADSQHAMPPCKAQLNILNFVSE